MVQTESKSVNKWLSRLGDDSRAHTLMNFMRWLADNSTKFSEFDPDMLVDYQRVAESGEQYEILDEVQRYIQGLELRYKTKTTYYSTLRAFFIHNRVPLPDDPSFQLRSDIPSVVGELPLKELRNLLFSCKENYRAIFLSMFQGAMDQESFIFWNENGWEKLREDLKADPEVIKIDLPGRKKWKNRRSFYTLIGGDSITAIRNWLKIRPDEIPRKLGDKTLIKNPYIFTNQNKQPIKKQGLYMLWRRTLQGLDYIERSDGVRVWSGKGPHEMRDTFRSMWEKSPAKASVAEFLMGHKVDALGYNKAFRDEDWTRGEYLKALPHLQIISSGRPFGQVDEGLVARQNNRIAELENLVEGLRVELREERARARC